MEFLVAGSSLAVLRLWTCVHKLPSADGPQWNAELAAYYPPATSGKLLEVRREYASWLF